MIPGSPQQSPPAPAPQGTLSNSFSAITNSPHQNFSDVKWVPSWAVSGELQVVLAVLSLVGGALFGSGLTSLLDSNSTPVRATIVAVASACVNGQKEVCDSISISTSSGWWQTITGTLLIVAYGAAVLYGEFKRRPGKS